MFIVKKNVTAFSTVCGASTQEGARGLQLGRKNEKREEKQSRRISCVESENREINRMSNVSDILNMAYF